MDTNYISRLQTFTNEDLPNLDEAVLGALQLFSQTQLPKIDLAKVYKRPLVVGSGNAEATGRIIFNDFDAIFASESSFEDKLKNIDSIDGVVVVSASGGKHAPIIVETAQKYGKHVSLITNTENSEAGQKLDRQHDYDEFVFPKNREPYTYNTSTYMGMILGHTGENPATIIDFIQQQIDVHSFPDLSKYQKFYLIVPPQFEGIIRMLHVKFIELFGRKIARDVETSEYVRHATTVVPSDELFISFGEKNEKWGEPQNRLHIPLPQNANYGAMMAIGYYVIAQIQKQHPAYFKQNIEQYTQKMSADFGQEIKVIVG